MAKFSPPPRLVYSQAFTAIQEEARMAALGARFMVWNGCFHYLIPASWLDGELDGNPAPFAIYSCLYDPKTRELTLRDIAPFEDHVAWEERAKEIGIKLLDQDPNKLLRD